MSNQTPITIVGNLTADPELRFTPSGAAVANFTVAVTPRSFNKTSNEWEDGEAAFWNCAVWREAAEHVAESLTKGMRVVVTGDVQVRRWESREGVKGTSYEIKVDEVGPSLKYGTAKFTRDAPRQQGGQQGGGGWGQQQAPQQWQPGNAAPRTGGPMPRQDPWAGGAQQPMPQYQPQPQPPQGRDPWAAAQSQEPPF